MAPGLTSKLLSNRSSLIKSADVTGEDHQVFKYFLTRTHCDMYLFGGAGSPFAGQVWLSSCAEWGLLPVEVHRLLQGLLLLQSTGSRYGLPGGCSSGLSCSMACGIFLPGSNPCLPCTDRWIPTAAPPGKSKTTKSCHLKSFLAVKDLSGPTEVCWKVPPSGTSSRTCHLDQRKP